MLLATLAAMKRAVRSFTRLQGLIGLTSDNLITHLRELEEARHIATEKYVNGAASLTLITLRQGGRAALSADAAKLRDIPGERQAADE